MLNTPENPDTDFLADGSIHTGTQNSSDKTESTASKLSDNKDINTINPLRTTSNTTPPPADNDIHQLRTKEELKEANYEMIKLRQREADIQKQITNLEETERRQAEYHASREEMEKALTRGITILNEETIQAKRNAKQLEDTLQTFSEMLDKIKYLNHDAWTEKEYSSELTKALSLLENARMEWNSARIRISSLDETKNATESQNSDKLSAISSYFEEVNNLSFSQIFKLGIILQWPILLSALLIFSLILTVLLK